MKKFMGFLLSAVMLLCLAAPITAMSEGSSVRVVKEDIVKSGGTIYYDRWGSSQYTGDFTDALGVVYEGIGMYASIGASGSTGTAFVELNIPQSAQFFSVCITAEKNWCSTESYGVSTFTIYADDAALYQKTIKQTIPAELVTVAMPAGAKTLRLEVYQDWKGKSGNHACIWGTPAFDGGSPGGEVWSNASVWAVPELKKAAEAGLIPEALYNTDLTAPITRAEFAAVAVQLYEVWSGNAINAPQASPFTDISLDPCRLEIQKAYATGFTNGTSATAFSPAAFITREQLATMLCRVYKAKEWPNWTLATDGNFTLNYSGVEKFADDAYISEYAVPSVYFMVKYGVISGMGNNTFAPRNITSAQEAVGYATATREQSILMSLRSFEKLN